MVIRTGLRDNKEGKDLVCHNSTIPTTLNGPAVSSTVTSSLTGLVWIVVKGAMMKLPLKLIAQKAAELGENPILPGRPQRPGGRPPRVGRVIKLYDTENPSETFKVMIVKESTRQEFEDQRRRMGLPSETRGVWFHEFVAMD